MAALIMPAKRRVRAVQAPACDALAARCRKLLLLHALKRELRLTRLAGEGASLLAASKYQLNLTGGSVQS
jgi:hypothetical protein